MPEALREAYVTWKVYGDPAAHLLFNILPYFKQYQTDVELAANAFAWQYPANFVADVVAGTLPQVSWIVPSAANCEHPAAPPSMGESLVHDVLSTLVANPAVWEHTVCFLVYDENGGWFDHVPPPTPSKSELGPAPYQGEWVTGMTGRGYVDGPVGLGFRVPCLILSPFTRGGFVCSPYYTDTEGNVRIDPAGTFDHTSINRFIARVFGAQGYDVTVPNLSAWRQSITGDFSVAFPRVFDTTVPRLPTPTTTDVEAAAAGVINGLAGTEHYAPQPYPPPTNNGTFPPPQDGRPLHHTYSPSD